MLNLNSLNPQQRQAVETMRGPVLILAGAGTGKTRVITYRTAHMIARGIAPVNILAVTFTNKAAREMRERVSRLVPRARDAERETRNHNDRPAISTFHSLCVRILRQHIEKLGYKRNFVIYDEAEQLGAVRKILARISAKGEKTDPAAVLAVLSRLKNGGPRASVFADASVRAMAEHVRGRYESALRACNAVDFDDLILLTLRLFQEHPEALEACRARYRYVMVDEYQDTNAAQFELVHALTREHRNLCVVGDDDQSIYGWRGADLANLLDMEKHFPEVKIIKLEQNYRSTDTILRAANAVIKNNARRRGKQLWSEKGRGCKITIRAFASDEDEARATVEEVEFQRLVRRVPWREQAVLFRANHQARPLEMALRQARVRYRLVGGRSYFDRREIRDFIAFLKVMLNPHDDVSLLRIANVPPRGLSDATMERLLAASQERKGSVFAAMRDTAALAAFQTKARECVERFTALVERSRAALDNPESARDPRALEKWADRFLSEIGYIEALRREERTQEAADARVRGIKELLPDLDSHAAADAPPRERLEGFLQEVALDSEREEEDDKAGDAVTLVTMHSCKGLEYPHVYVVGLEDGLLPHARSKAEGALDEERRLFYVAVTRARERLTLSHCESRRKYGRAAPCHPSPFLREIPGELVEHDGGQTKRPVTVESGRTLFDRMRAAIE